MLLTIYNLPYKGNEKRDISSLDRHSVATLASPQTPISTEEIGNIQGANENPPRRAEIKVRKNEMKVPKNEMKVPKNEMKVPKNFVVPHWRFKNSYRGNSRYYAIAATNAQGVRCEVFLDTDLKQYILQVAKPK